jgi:integrase
MSLYHRGNVWWVYIMIDGVRHCQSTGMTNRRMAQGFERKYREELEAKAAGFTELEPEMTFTELSARFLTSGEIKAHHTDRLKMLLPYWGTKELRSINRASVREYRALRIKRDKVTDTTVNRDLEVLRHLMFWAVDEGIIAANPLARLQMPRARRRKRPLLSWEDEQKLIAHSSVHLARIIIAALDTGMRRGELTHQLWEDVDLSRGVLSVTRSKTAEGEQREIPLTNRLRAMLSVCQQSSGLVFTFNGEAIAQLKTGWAGAIRRSGIPRMRFHDLRHCHNTRLLELGVLADTRKALMGHSSGDDVHSIYSHVELPLKRKAIALLDAWIAEKMRESQPQTTMETKDERQTRQPNTRFPRSGASNASAAL